jgi:signal peptidase II
VTTKAKIFWIVFVLGLVADQATKLWIVANIPEGSAAQAIHVIPGFFDIVHAENPGAAFSMFRDFEYRMPLFLGFTVFATWIVWSQLKALPAHDRLFSAALGLIASGALGNFVDRVTKQTVTDFLRFYTTDPGWVKWLDETIGMHEYPSFNIADSTLLVGVIILLFAGRRAEAPASASDAGAPKEVTGG